MKNADIVPSGLEHMSPQQFAFHCAVLCLCFGVDPAATISEGLIEAKLQGSTAAASMLRMIGVTPELFPGDSP